MIESTKKKKRSRMIESTQKKRREAEWLNQHKKKLPNRRKKKENNIAALQQSFFLLDRSFNLSFFFLLSSLGTIANNFFFSQLLWPYHLFWDKSDLPAQLIVLKKKETTHWVIASEVVGEFNQKKKTTLLPSIVIVHSWEKKRHLQSILTTQRNQYVLTWALLFKTSLLICPLN